MDPSPLHLAAVGHLLGGNGADASLVTLNFDTLLEQAIAVETGMAAHSSTDGQVDGPQGHGPHSVFHLHGVITPQLSESVVLTLTDFTDLIADSNSWQSRYLQEAAGRGALVIAGTSYRDPDLRQWLRIALEQKPAEHSALVLLAREGFALSKAQFIEIQRALYDQWSAVGLHPVLLQDHSDAAQIIRELRSVHSPGYRAPQQRALDVWNSHVDRFDEMQEQYVDQLEADAEIMRDALGVDDLNLTLWLANGAGQLARWAAQDRIYRDVSALRMVETGHDSPWIAGQALGRDSMLLEDLDNEGTGRWRCVLALPVPVPHPWLPTLSTAVLTIGMAEPIDDIEGLRLMWEEPLAEIADRWGDRLSVLAFSDDPRRLPDTHDEEA